MNEHHRIVGEERLLLAALHETADKVAKKVWAVFTLVFLCRNKRAVVLKRRVPEPFAGLLDLR